MQPHSRYDIIAQIASGDFASVFRARDKELARDVAIKQIHPHYLADPRQLNLYWDEAQTLASLEHPNVLTIYDIARKRGWLVLELMKDTMQMRAAGEPMDLELVRMGLICGLKALDFLHKSDIIHGDVKPSNLLIDRRNWIKLADFGFAQRATNDGGSLFKGTTRYIAPERVDTEQFGPVGPASDLYSLGFSMYELLCGRDFESLFPGLAAFGSNTQIAWMMWHAGPDRRMPAIERVLKGVPEDLAYVIERLVIKNPDERYRDAEEALRDLKLGMGQRAGKTAAEKAEEEAIAREAAQQKRRKKLLIFGGISMMASLLIILLIPFLTPPTPPPPQYIPDIQGTIVQILDPPQASAGVPATNSPSIIGMFVVDADRIKPRGKEPLVGDEISAPQTLKIHNIDQLLINNERRNLRDPQFNMDLFKVGDSVSTKVANDLTTGRQIQTISVTRPVEDSGIVVDVQENNSAFVIKSKLLDNDLVKVHIPDEESPKRQKIVFKINDKKKTTDASEAVRILKEGDHVHLSHNVFFKDGKATNDRELVTHATIRVVRNLTTEGDIQNLDMDRRTLTVRTRDNKTVLIPIADDCEVVLNGRSHIRDRRLTLSDLKYQDLVLIKHRAEAQSIKAKRTSTGDGSIINIFPSARKLRIQLGGNEPRVANFGIPEHVPLRLGTENVSIDDLQPTDTVSITYDGTDPNNPVLSRLEAHRPPDRHRWAIVIGLNQYNDRTLSPVTHLGRDADRVIDALTKRYRVPADQTLNLRNVTRTALRSKVKSFLRQIRPGDELTIYLAGHAFIDSDNQPQLAAKDFEFLDPAGSGLPLRWLIEQVETCEAGEKTLFLDTCHEGSGADLRQQPSSEEQIQYLEADRYQPALKTLRIVTSCSNGQRGQRDLDGGLFAAAIQAAYEGDADANSDRKISLQEISDYIRQSLEKRTRGSQTSLIVKPGKISPPRLSEAVRMKMEALAKRLARKRGTSVEISRLVDTLERIGGDELEPQLLCGLAEIRIEDYRDAANRFEDFENSPIALQGIIWSYFRQQRYDDAVDQLVKLAGLATQMINGNAQQENEAKRLFEWMGRLREYAEYEARKSVRISDLDARQIDDAVNFGNVNANDSYTEGRQVVRDIADKYNRKIDEATSEAQKTVDKGSKARLSNYVNFNMALLIQQIMRSAKDVR